MIKSRLISAYIIVFLAFVILITRYSFFQLFGHSTYLQQSINNYSSTVATIPTRGTIIDKNGVVLANNIVSYAVGMLPKDYKKTKSLFTKLNKYINITKLDKRKFNNQLRNVKNYDIVIIKDDLSNSEVAKLTAHNFEIPQITVFARTKRYYPFSDNYAHSIGYVGRISTNDLIKMPNKLKDYLPNEYIGKNGLEKYYEPILRGFIGKKVIQTDAFGNEIGLIKNSPAIDGNTIQLTLDNKLQNLSSILLSNYSGAIVAINPQNGGILSFVSNPGFNPNWFIDGISSDDWIDLQDDPNKPLLNRASQSSYPPGSTFKPFLGLVALDLGFRTPNSTTFDPGYFSIPGSKHRFRDNDHRYGLGNIAMDRAIALSSDTYFYKLAYDMGIDNIDKGMCSFGLGEITGIDLPNEARGLLPSRKWKEKRFSKNPYQRNWLPADSVTVGIGQGFNHYTPLQMAYATTIIANDGVAIKPHFLKKVINNDGETIAVYKIESHIIQFSKSNFEFIKKSMQLVITQGTAKGISYGLAYKMAGKTGTAQVVSTVKNGRKQKFAGHQYKDHSWFIAFAPIDKPQIAIAIIVENGGFGASAAAPIARKLFDLYLLGNNQTILQNKRKSIVKNLNQDTTAGTEDQNAPQN
ncbi:MAG: penicillin-binding protein 2 [Burkholderiales bacterium]|nr:penicillin-binding protein 2 [Burkholderiales bacterium]